jgi:hypothetical protein
MTLRLRRWLKSRIAELLGGVDPNIKAMIDQRIAKNNEETIRRVEKGMTEIRGQIVSVRAEILQTLGQKLTEQKREDEKRIVELRNALASERHAIENLIGPEEFIVPQKSSVNRPIEISLGNKKNVRIKGEFQASGESRNDVKFYAFDEFNFDKFVNKQPFHALDESPNVSRYSFVIPITHSGRYYLFFDNTFSTFSPKTVSLNVQIEYDAVPI